MALMIFMWAMRAMWARIEGEKGEREEGEGRKRRGGERRGRGRRGKREERKEQENSLFLVFREEALGILGF